MKWPWSQPPRPLRMVVTAKIQGNGRGPTHQVRCRTCGYEFGVYMEPRGNIRCPQCFDADLAVPVMAEFRARLSQTEK